MQRCALLLIMTDILEWHKESPHPEEAAERLSRRTRWCSAEPAV